MTSGLTSPDRWIQDKRRRTGFHNYERIDSQIFPTATTIKLLTEVVHNVCRKDGKLNILGVDRPHVWAGRQHRL